jgi:hypothetical protein
VPGAPDPCHCALTTVRTALPPLVLAPRLPALPSAHSPPARLIPCTLALVQYTQIRHTSVAGLSVTCLSVLLLDLGSSASCSSVPLCAPARASPCSCSTVTQSKFQCQCLGIVTNTFYLLYIKINSIFVRIEQGFLSIFD